MKDHNNDGVVKVVLGLVTMFINRTVVNLCNIDRLYVDTQMKEIPEKFMYLLDLYRFM